MSRNASGRTSTKAMRVLAAIRPTGRSTRLASIVRPALPASSEQPGALQERGRRRAVPELGDGDRVWLQLVERRFRGCSLDAVVEGVLVAERVGDYLLALLGHKES